MNDIQVGDWVTLVNLDDEDLHEGVVFELGKRYQVLWISSNRESIVVDGIHLINRPFDSDPHPSEGWYIYTYCFEKENPFVTAVREITDEDN